MSVVLLFIESGRYCTMHRMFFPAVLLTVVFGVGATAQAPERHVSSRAVGADGIHLSAMNTKAFRKVHPQGLLPFNLMGMDSAFSPNGELLALVLATGIELGQKQEMWLYRLPTAQLKLVEYPSLGSFYASGLLWQGNQLYMRAALVSPRGQPKQAFAAASFDEDMVKVLPVLPPAVQPAYARFEKEPDSNTRFRVWSESSCKVKPDPHCGQGTVLLVEDKSTHRRQLVSLIDPVYLFDSENSVVLYIAEIEGRQHGVTALDLPTKRKRITPLPGDAELHLMAGRRVADGYLIAYWISGDCNPAGTDRKPAAAGRNGPDLPQVSVCFATIALPQSGASTPPVGSKARGAGGD